MTDLWSEDMREHYVSADLTPTQVALRDGTAPESPYVGLARQQRLAQMERDLANLADFVTDCDRYREAINHYDNPCVGVLVPQMMGRYLDDLRARAIAKGKRVREELAILRSRG